MNTYEPRIGDVIRYYLDEEPCDLHLIVSEIDVDEYDNPSVLTVDLSDRTASRFYRPVECGVKVRDATNDELRIVVSMLSANAWEVSPVDWNQMRSAVNEWTRARMRTAGTEDPA